MQTRALGRTGLQVPPIVFGTSCLGNLYAAIPYETKLSIMTEFFRHVPAPVVLDTAGKYGAGLALEVIGRGLRGLGVPAGNVVISNKLGWARIPLRGPEPLFEPGAWKDLAFDAEQRLNGDGILECWRQGCDLLGAPYRPQVVSVHDPDEYLAQAKSASEREQRLAHILDAYSALFELKHSGQVAAVGVGAKDWHVIRELAERVDLDWVMFACSMTIMHHPPELLTFMAGLNERGVGMINSAVFHAGFLTGGTFFDYRVPDPADAEDRKLFAWRERFQEACRKHGVSPAAACVQFGMSVPGVVSIALNTGKPERVRENVALVQEPIAPGFWKTLKDQELIARDYPYLA